MIELTRAMLAILAALALISLLALFVAPDCDSEAECASLSRGEDRGAP